MAIPHALVIPFCAQGHVTPLMEFSHHLADHGVLVTFVYTEHIHRHVMAALSENFSSDYVGRIRLVTIPDGLVSDDDRKDLSKVFSVIPNTTPSFIEEIILKVNEKDENKITFVIVDWFMGFVLDVAKKLNLPRAALWPASSWTLAVILNIQMLIDDGVVDQNGFQTGDKLVRLCEGVPALKSAHLCWVPFGDTKQQEIFFKYLQKCAESMKGLNHILCNTFEELESPFLHLTNNAIPIGPLLPANKLKHQPSSIWAEDSSCIDWLNQQPMSSVIYVSLGSSTVLSQCQLGELALGLELTGRPFLWVSRPNIMDHSVAVYPEGFMDGVTRHALIVRWAPQKEVLSHPSVACFLTHCGWNSTMEAVSNGVPMLCWPYFADQFLNQTSIVEVWKVGLKLGNEDERVVIGKEEIKEKLELLINDKGMRARAAYLKEKGMKAVMEGGTSARNFEGFVHIIKNTISLE